MLRWSGYLLLGVVSLGWAAGTSRAADHTKDSVDTVRKNLADKKAVLLDVREPQEWEAGHLADARLVPLSKLRESSDPRQLVKDVKPGTIVYCHCKAGGRALTAADILSKAGYDVRPLKPGYDELLKQGLP